MKSIALKEINAIIPENWSAEEEEGTLSLYDPKNGEGALTISLFSNREEKKTGVAVWNLYNGFISQFFDNKRLVKPITQQHKNVTVLSGEGNDTNGWFVRIWCVEKLPRLLLASYTCEEKTQEVMHEIEQCEAIVQSIADSLAQKNRIS